VTLETSTKRGYAVNKDNNVELFVELMKRSLAFRILAILTKYDNIRPLEIVSLLNYKYGRESIQRALQYLARNGLIERNDFKISLNTRNAFVASLVRFVNMLLNNGLWNELEKVLLGSKGRIRVLIALIHGPMTKSQLVKECRAQGGMYIDRLLEPLIRHKLIIVQENKGVVYKLNNNHPLVNELVNFLREISIDNRNNYNYAEMAKSIVDYIIQNWDKYAINTHKKDTIKLTGNAIKEIVAEKNLKVRHNGWLVSYVIEELKERGFSVRVEKNGHKPNISKIRIYVYRAVD